MDYIVSGIGAAAVLFIFLGVFWGRFPGPESRSVPKVDRDTAEVQTV